MLDEPVSAFDGEASESASNAPATKRGRARRAKILNAAIRLIWRDGYESVGIDAILKEAATQKGSFYYFFPSKLDLLSACLDHLWGVQRHQLEEIVSSAPSGRAALSMQLIWLCEAQRAAHRRYGYVPGLFHMSIGTTALRLDDSVTQKIKAYADEHTAMIRESLRRIAAEEGLIADPEMLAQFIGAAIGGTILRARIENDIQPIVDLPNSIFGVIDSVRRKP